MASDPRWVVGTLDQVGKFWGIALDTVSDWRRQGMPGMSGHYDLSAIAAWFRTYRHGGPGGNGETGTKNPMARARLAREVARAEREQIMLERMKGTLVSLEDSDAKLKRLVLWLDGVFQRLGADLHAKLAKEPRRRTQEVIDQYVYELRDDLTKRGDVERDDKGAGWVVHSGT